MGQESILLPHPSQDLGRCEEHKQQNGPEAGTETNEEKAQENITRLGYIAWVQTASTGLQEQI